MNARTSSPAFELGLIAIAFGSFALGFAEFVMMGVLPEVAAGVNVSVPEAGNFVSAYAIGVCFGTLILVFGRRVPPKDLLVAFMVLVFVGNALAACAVSANMLTVARFVSGLPHGAYFGTATIAARALAQRGREGQAVAIMVLGQTVANTLGVPGGTLLAELISWRATFAFVALWAVGSFVLIWRWVPVIAPIPDAGLGGQFRFLKKPGPWLVIGGVLLGNTGIFCWWSYVSPWLTNIGGFPSVALPALLVVAGSGMIIGSQAGGRLADRTTPGKMAAAGQLVSAISLVSIFAFSASSPIVAVVLMATCSFGMFFVGSPQQILMVQVGRGGGEMIGSACVQVAFNGGNALGAAIGQGVLNTGAAYTMPALAGAPITLGAVLLFVVFFRVFEPRYRAAMDADIAARKAAVSEREAR